MGNATAPGQQVRLQQQSYTTTFNKPFLPQRLQTTALEDRIMQLKPSQLTSTASIKPYPTLLHPSLISFPQSLPLLFPPVFKKTSTASRHRQQSTTNTCLSEHSVGDGRIPVTKKRVKSRCEVSVTYQEFMPPHR